jgi:hypothetical protein
MPQERYEELRQQLDAEQLIEIAKKTTGLSDFGVKFYEQLHKLLDCAAREIDFHAQGLERFKNEMVRGLANQLRMQDDLRKHPEILDEDISDPIIITGVGRSGTTKLHRMLSAPDNVQKTLFWRMWNPARFPGAKPGQPDPRIAVAGSSHIVTEDNPVVNAAHHMAVNVVEEDSMLYELTFGCWAWTQMLTVPSFFDWIISRSRIESYRYVKIILQYLQWQDGGKRDRPWILKSPQYVGDLEQLLECYPNATLVHTHRDPLDTMPSYAKLIGGMHALVANPTDPHFLGQESVRMWAVIVNLGMEMRDRLNLDDRILDVKYEQVRTDPMSIIREVYRRAGRALSPEAEREMAAWHATNEQGRHGKHEYSLEEFGLSEAGVNKAFSEYIRRFISR